jgi:hypothetical protein
VNELPRARLSKDRKWAVCFGKDCGKRFAKRIEVPAVIGGPVLDFGPGWVTDGNPVKHSPRLRSSFRPPRTRRAGEQGLHPPPRAGSVLRWRFYRRPVTSNKDARRG